MAAQEVFVPVSPRKTTARQWAARLVLVFCALAGLLFFILAAQTLMTLPRFQLRAAAGKSTAVEILQPTPAGTQPARLAVFPTHTAAPTAMPTPSATPIELAGSQRMNDIDGQTMVYIPAGTFRMGNGSFGIKRHAVTLNAYWISLTQVTNAQYRRCVEAGGCSEPIRKEINPHYYDPEFDDHPTVYIVWGQAADYCAWAGGRLPTEAEWERAASGDGKRKYPWGNAGPDSKRANVNRPNGTTRAVGSYPAGASPFGVLDMGGNVREWIYDWYRAGYDTAEPATNPTGPETGKKHVLRGAAWHDPAEFSSVFTRYGHVPNSAGWNRGFRCVFPIVQEP